MNPLTADAPAEPAHPSPPAGARSGRASWARRVTAAAGWVALAGLAVPALARATGWEAGPLAFLVALTPWMTLALVVPLVLGAVSRAWALVVASLVLAGAGVAWQAPLLTAADASGEHALTVASVNLTYGEAAADEVVALVREHGVDVLVAQELTPEAVVALAAAGLDAELPHAQLAPEPGVTGTGLWSREPLVDPRTLEGFTLDRASAPYVSKAVEAGVVVAGERVTVLAVHPAAPGPVDHAAWDSAMASLTEHLDARRGPIVVAGDFNTTRDHRAFRDILALGYADAADQAGAGLTLTFPEGRTPVPLVGIDHALVRDAGLVATSVAAVSVSGADHRALVVAYSGE